ncbi:ABC transporter substrate-binding protein [Oceanospirillum linum]|uniref:Thiamine pyrimidine synthase n=1 Tax=Oceanospirillum linum TaxID=966 RepID=A0A1T1HAL0_OCELI|nr:ABC transporter substrate-binding protein [Oceanospirillum linum]OOV86855.1 hypothetical protein BTA35_0211185 [Oceanospirillum linum]SEG20711.1 diguanylate cyclase (GGDEF) domain-containing protein [Oleiphilus messinensis]SMP24682.1 diguanylate cyclase (GGDEF) domain-containing protein [Oceanospirillum linum]
MWKFGQASKTVPPLNEVLNGNADFGVAASELLLARAKGQPVIAMGVIFQHSASAMATLTDNGIYTPQDFIGQRLEMGDLSSGAETYAMLQAEGITPRQYEQIPSSFSLHRLINGDVSAVSVFVTNQPFYLKEQQIPYRLILPRSYGIDFYGDTLFTREKLAEDNPQLVEAFHRAAFKGWRYAFDRPGEVIDIILEKYSDFPFSHSRKHLEYEHREMEKLVLPNLVELGHMNIGRWHHMANTFVSLGLLQPDYSLEGFLWSPETPKPYFQRLNLQILGVVTICVFLMGLSLLTFNRRLQYQATQNQLLTKEKEELEKKIDMIFWSGDFGYWHWNRSKNVLYLNEKAAAALGGQHEAGLFTLQEIQVNESLISVRHFFSWFSEDIRKRRGRFELERERLDDEGQTCWLTCRGEVLDLMPDGSIKTSHGILLDNTELHRARQQVEQLTITDAMTGLLNLRYFMGRLEAFMQRVKFGEGYFSVALVDIDRMDMIRNEYGSYTADYVIETLSDIIQQQARPMDLIARYTDTSFAVLLPGTTAEETQSACDRMRKHIAHYRFDTSSHNFFATVTIGIVETQEFSSTDLSSKQLLHVAEERIETGKLKGCNVLITRNNQTLTSP